MTNVYPHLASLNDEQLLAMFRQLKLVVEGDHLPLDTVEDGYKEVQKELDRRGLEREE